MNEINTEQSILNAAMNVFQKKGMAGARMQEIADEAKINKAMLHYYFRNKQQLFEAVFMRAFSSLAPQLNLIFTSDDTVFEKIRKFTSSYIDFILLNPFLPSFIIQEMNNNPLFVKRFMTRQDKLDPKPFLEQIQKEIDRKKIRDIDPRQILLNILSMTIFPFVADIMIKSVVGISDHEFIDLMGARKTLISDHIIRSIQV